VGPESIFAAENIDKWIPGSLAIALAPE